jgi:hypothetical protein
MKDLFGSLLPNLGKAGTATDPDNDLGTHEDGVDVPTSTDAPTRTDRIFPWTRVHSHFELMGGFAFDTSNMPVNILPAGRTRLTLTPFALRKLASNEPNLIPDISEEAIKDKSKSNSFAKFLVCLQACWFIVQTVGRLATSSAISLLEMNTLLHAVCCLLVYLAWWHKLHDIDEPVLISTSTDLARKVCAWMVMYSRAGTVRKADDGPQNEMKVLSTLRLVYDDDLRHQDPINVPGYLQDMLMATRAAQTNNKNLRRAEQVHPNDDGIQNLMVAQKQRMSLKLYPGRIVHGFRLVPLVSHEHRKATCNNVYTRLTLGDMECVRLAKDLRMKSNADTLWRFVWTSVSINFEQEMLTKHASITSSPDTTLGHFLGSNRLTSRFNTKAKYVFWAGWLADGSVYGAIHLIAWNGPFTTRVERWMWRSSCLIIAAPGLLMLLVGMGSYLLLGVVYLLLVIHDSMCHWRWFRRLMRRLRINVNVIDTGEIWSQVLVGGLLSIFDSVLFLVLLFCSLAVAYAAARVYILIECFINLAHLSPAVYQEPDWSQYIPHFGSG